MRLGGCREAEPVTHTFESPSAARVDLVLALVALDDVSPVFSARFLCIRQSVCAARNDGQRHTFGGIPILKLGKTQN